jgi:hypothetical protein
MLMTQTEFVPSCRLMELDVIGTTTMDDTATLQNTTLNGTVYTERRLYLSVEFLGGLFMNIEQKAEYTGFLSFFYMQIF